MLEVKHILYVTDFSAASDAALPYARQTPIDLIVVGSHGPGSFAERLVGSVADRVVRHATCPVVTVKGSEAHRA